MTVVDDAVARLLPMSLDRLLALPDLQTRIDRKYLVPAALSQELLARCADSWRVLEIDDARTFEYRSLYFDTPDLESFRTSSTGRRNRFKVRLRTYLADGRQSLEVKTKGPRNVTVKDRLELAPGHADAALDADDVAFVDAKIRRSIAATLRPTVVTTYHRRTLVGCATLARATVDTNVRCAAPAGGELAVTEHLMIETKTAGTPTDLDRLLWAQGIRPMRMSKFGLAMVLVHGVPANRWHRILVDHCGWRRP